MILKGGRRGVLGWRASAFLRRERSFVVAWHLVYAALLLWVVFFGTRCGSFGYGANKGLGSPRNAVRLLALLISMLACLLMKISNATSPCLAYHHHHAKTPCRQRELTASKSKSKKKSHPQPQKKNNPLTHPPPQPDKAPPPKTPPAAPRRRPPCPRAPRRPGSRCP